MKTRILITTLCAAGLLAAAGTAFAQATDTATLGVKATVNGTCKFQDNGGNIEFPPVASDVAANQTATNASDPITFWCTKRASYTITDDRGLWDAAGQRRMKHTTLSAPDEFLNYGLAYTATGTGNGPTSPITLGVTADISSSDLANAAAGEFTDTVTFTFTP